MKKFICPKENIRKFTAQELIWMLYSNHPNS